MSVEVANCFSPYQLKVIDLMRLVKNDEQMREICDLLSKYFAKKAVEEADRLWDDGKIDQATIESWKHEHMRTSH